jgi:hypothetical protein
MQTQISNCDAPITHETVRPPIVPSLFSTGPNLQLLEDSIGAGDLQGVLGSFLGGVGDLAVIDDDHVAVSAALWVSPADTLRETGLGVGEEELEEEMSANRIHHLRWRVIVI